MASDDVRALLGRLAGSNSPGDGGDGTAPRTDYGRTIERATAVLDDLDAAAKFVENGGLQRLEGAVERAQSDLSERAPEGRETLRSYRAFRAAARGDDGSSTDASNTEASNTEATSERG